MKKMFLIIATLISLQLFAHEEEITYFYTHHDKTSWTVTHKGDTIIAQKNGTPISNTYVKRNDEWTFNIDAVQVKHSEKVSEETAQKLNTLSLAAKHFPEKN